MNFFVFSIVLTEETMCNIKENSSTAELISSCSLFIVDEITMLNRKAIEAADRTFQWIRNSDKPFGGVIVLFSGDWRQMLPIVRNAGKTEIINATLKSSYLWENVIPLKLTRNMRLQQENCDNTNTEFE